MKITYPADGELLNNTSGTLENGTLTIQISGTTAPGNTVRLDSESVTAGPDGSFSISCRGIREIFNEVTVSDGTAAEQVRFVYDSDDRKRYNFFIDDNIFFLTDLVRGNCKSIFESFYLDFLRKLHREYGFKVTLNMFYGNSHDTEKNFTTSDLDDRYKTEFEDNSDWLKLAFHAYAEFPDAPYCKAYPEKLPEHHKLVTDEIKRYAGGKTLIEPVLMHFYEITCDASRKYTAQQGMNCFTKPEKHWNALDAQLGRHIQAQYNYHFGQLEIPLLFMVNLFPEDQLLAKLDAAYSEKGRNFLLLGTHEQYSYPRYFNYIPEHFQRMESVVRSLTDHGYEPVYFTETLLKK